MNNTLFRLLALLALIPALVGCFRSGKPDRFYMLRAVEAAQPIAAPAEEGLRIGLGPIRIPAYLDRPQIVTAVSEQEYRLSENHRWAERLDVTVTRVSAENLGSLLPTGRIIPYPWPRDSRPDVQVAINVQEMHLDPKNQVRLEALWTLRQGKDLTLSRKFSCQQQVPADDYAGMVEAESQCLARLNRDIAAAIRGLEPDSAAPEKR